MKAAPSLPASILGLVCVALLADARTITVTTSRDELDNPSGPQISLREAVRDLGGASGTICLASSVLELTLDRELFLSSSGGLIVLDAAGFGGAPIKIVPGGSFDGVNLIRVENQRAQIKNAIFERPASLGRERLPWAIDTRGGADLRLEDCRFENWVSDQATAAAVRCLSGSVLNVLDCEFRGNAAGIRGVSSPDTLTVQNSLFFFHRDSAIETSIDADANITIRNSTFAENVGGSAVVVFNGPTGPDKILLHHCTVVDNLAPGFRGPTASIIDHCLFARNIPTVGDGKSVSISEFSTFGATSAGYNLVDDSPASLDAATDLKGLAVRVSRLGDFGGERFSCFPLAGSRAIDGGNPNRTTVLPATDVRGFARKAKSFGLGTFTNIVDIGAVEANPEGTLVVDQTGNFGSGSLRDAVANSSGETAHIVIQPPIGSRIFVINTPIIFDADRTYNIDGSRGLYEFKGQSDEGPLLEITGVNTTLSFSGLRVEDYALDEFTRRGFVRVVDGKLALHESHFERNQTEETGIIQVVRGRVFLNECSFVDNVISGDASVGEFGGVALDLDQTVATVWNSTFLRNRTEMRNGSVNFEGGAVRMLRPLASTFRQCTFARNKADGSGAAVYFGDYSSTAGPGLTFDRCTIVGNENTFGSSLSRGAVAFENRASVEVGACLFAHNFNRGDEPEDNDLFSRGGEETVVVSRPCPNWTNWPEAFPGLVEPGNLSAVLRFAPAANWGGEVPTMPLLVGHALAVECDDPAKRYPRDAMNEIGFGGPQDLPTPGAVQRALVFSEALDITLLSLTETTATVRVRGRHGIEWIIEDTVDLQTFSPTGLTYTGSFLSTTIQIPIRQPSPASWFYRFREVAD